MGYSKPSSDEELRLTSNTPPLVPPGDGVIRNDVPLAERDVITFKNGGISDITIDGLPLQGQPTAVNFSYIEKTGEIPQFQPSVLDSIGMARVSPDDNYRIDLKADDSYNQTRKEIEQKAIEQIQQSPELSALLQKDSWDRDDRIAWERDASRIVSEIAAETPGLDDYRYVESGKDLLTAESRPPLLNALSDDIDAAKNGDFVNTNMIEYDCEAMAITEGLILQRVENALLPDNAPTGEFKQSFDYFTVSGQRYNGLAEDQLSKGGYHQFNVSSATFNAFEPTVNKGSTYRVNIDPNYSAEDFIAGKEIITNHNSVYKPGMAEIDLDSVREHKAEFETTAEAKLQHEREKLGITGEPKIITPEAARQALDVSDIPEPDNVFSNTPPPRMDFEFKSVPEAERGQNTMRFGSADDPLAGRSQMLIKGEPVVETFKKSAAPQPNSPSPDLTQDLQQQQAQQQSMTMAENAPTPAGPGGM